MSLTIGTQNWSHPGTLPGPAYFSPDVFEEEKQKIFFADWFCVGREEQIPEVHDYLATDVVGENIIVTRTPNGFRAFYNSCRHRGTLLCDDGPGHAKSGVIKCPYHAWTYTTAGELVGTPNVHAEEGFDKAGYPLWQLAVDTWEGFLFVNMADEPRPLERYIADDPEQPDQFGRYGLSDLRIGATKTYDIAANWKVLFENYNECLHCPSVHPELVDVVPLYRAGRVEEDDESWGVHLAEGATSMTLTGRSEHPRLPGISEDDAHCYYGSHLFMSLSLNLTSDCVVAVYYNPTGPERTTATEHFLFRPETIAAPDFDPSDLLAFDAIVYEQDIVICEREQRGIHSRGYRRGGVYPYADRYVHSLNAYYRERMGWAPPV